MHPTRILLNGKSHEVLRELRFDNTINGYPSPQLFIRNPDNQEIIVLQASVYEFQEDNEENRELVRQRLDNTMSLYESNHRLLMAWFETRNKFNY